jgi:type IX secretion system PorP/SprF family membrane protein
MGKIRHTIIRSRGRPLLFSLFALICFGSEVLSQDGQFSFQSESSLLINPALAGSESDYRATLNYRSQWKSLGTPFTTSAGSFDMRLTKSQKQANSIGLGVVILTDKSEDDSYRATSILAAASYHLFVTKNSALSGALSLSLEQRNLNGFDARWGSQFNGFAFDPALSSGEVLPQDVISRMDIGSGLVYTVKKKPRQRGYKLMNKLSVGIAGYHLGSLVLNESVGLSPQSQARIAGFLRGSYSVGEKVAIEPGFYGHFQGGSTNIILGSEVRYLLNPGDSFISKSEQMSVRAGLFSRLNDALIVNTALEWASYSLGLSYDINMSGLSDYSSGRGAFELFVRWQLDRSLYRR